jgi:hypothetical protein
MKELRKMTLRILKTALIVLVIAGCPALLGQGVKKPLTNADVIKMVKGGLPESVVVSAIQAGPAKFDISPDGLIALHKAGVTQGEMDAILASGHPSGGATAPQPAPAAAAATGADASSPAPAPKGHMPQVTVVQDGASMKLPLEKTQLAQTKTKPTSMRTLAADSAMTQGIGTATMGVASQMNSGIGGSAVAQVGSVFSGVLAHRTPTVTYVWGVPNPASTTILQTTAPAFSVDFSNVMGVNLDDFEPAIVKLTPAQNTCRIVGATRGKEDAQSGSAADWEIYSSFLEERVTVSPQKVKPGQYKISPSSEIMPGEYAIVLRPISKSKKFSGGDVARGQGDGLMFDAVWSFQVLAQ